jgi:hypothetical protein
MRAFCEWQMHNEKESALEGEPDEGYLDSHERFLPITKLRHQINVAREWRNLGPRISK